MECDDRIETLIDDRNEDDYDLKKQRLSSIISGGKAVQYLGKDITISQLEELSNGYAC